LFKFDGGEPYYARTLLSGDTDLPGAADFRVETPNVLGILFSLNRDEIFAKLNRQIDQQARDDEALSPENRAAKIAKMNEEIFQLECAEESLAWNLLREGKQIELREDVSALAILSARRQ
jgi:hypothetical protein